MNKGSQRIERKWIRFVEGTPKPKTKVWYVVSNEGDAERVEGYGIELGRIGWFGRWRGYAFFPNANMVFERTCLRDIANFIEEQTAQHREKRK